MTEVFVLRLISKAGESLWAEPVLSAQAGQRQCARLQAGFGLRMSLSENRYPLFRDMREKIFPTPPPVLK